LKSGSGAPLHIIPEVVSYQDGRTLEEQPYNKKLVDYGPINDIIYAETDSYVSVKAVRGACFSQHGAVPVSFGKIPTQSLSAMRLDPNTEVDRYQISVQYDELAFERALGGDKSSLKEHDPLFTIGSSPNSTWLRAVKDFQCVVFGSLTSRIGSIVILCKNDTGFVFSQVCKESGSGSHSLNSIIDLKRDDCIDIETRNVPMGSISLENCGHLAFLVLDSK
jgi:hypothetical protein